MKAQSTANKPANKNSNLHAAKSAKNDEFYTQLSDIEKELSHYKQQFRGKVVLCNCDDPRVSNFFKYFSQNFEHLGLKKLITTCYKNQDPESVSKKSSKKAVYLVYEGDKNGDRIPNASEIGIRKLEGDGDFRSPECIELLKQADIVVTNPPFSLFREYVAQLVEYKKKFIVVGNKNAITYKDIFSLIKSDQLWLGYTSPEEFFQPSGVVKKGLQGLTKWFTNLETKKRHEDLIFYRTYNKQDYPQFDNYKAINVDKTKDIPMDYKGAMGVPITFLDKYNPEQFEIIGLGISNSGIEVGVRPYKVEHKKYRREVQGRGAVDGDLYMMKNGIVDVPYARILIRNRKPQMQLKGGK